MEQAAELALVNHRDSRRDPPRTRNPLGSSNHAGPSLPTEAAPAPVRGEPDLRRTRNSAPVSRERGGSVAASALQPKSVLATSDALRLREFAQLSIIGAFVLLSPVLALSAAIAVEIAIDILLQAGGPPLPACVAAGAIGWLVLHRLGRRQGGAPIEI
jgi:hypothetical protein